VVTRGGRRLPVLFADARSAGVYVALLAARHADASAWEVVELACGGPAGGAGLSGRGRARIRPARGAPSGLERGDDEHPPPLRGGQPTD
jgi:hypothetical protein